ncbi:hypothetical protein FEF65_10155 [Mariprofundus erugo]|uniref:Histidine kinase n=1 Tax=Mariprofundus erugo TaxID=2528639 RepID=A0A5R9GLC7_9PROT|nr:FIST C-terminal domain-containing protein [Mariprofundus erugo]TLS66518.1 hypothetical protein FEF65_10155 [Mariprofundus erugo]
MYIASIQQLPQAIQQAATSYEQPIAVIMLAESHAGQINRIIDELVESAIPFIGAIFPALIHGDRTFTEGAIVNVFPAIAAPILITGLNRDDYHIPELLPAGAAGTGSPTGIILLDAMTTHTDTLLAGIFNQVGNRIHFFGGCSGFSDLVHRPCIFTTDGIIRDAAVIALTSLNSSLSARHGWQRLNHEPIIATRTCKNVVHEMNWEPAYDFYHTSVKTHGESDVTADAFYNKASYFPLGLYREHQEDVVRDPLLANTSDQSIQFASSVPENSVMYLLHGNTGSLIEAAITAVDDCCTAAIQADHCLIMDCFSRTLVLGDAFGRELAAAGRQLQIHGQHAIPEGAVTLGEISSYGEDYLELFNKTIVVGLLYA